MKRSFAFSARRKMKSRHSRALISGLERRERAKYAPLARLNGRFIYACSYRLRLRDGDDLNPGYASAVDVSPR